MGSLISVAEDGRANEGYLRTAVSSRAIGRPLVNAALDRLIHL